MARKLAEVDAYIAAAEPFARPILKHLRALVHAAQPEIEEAIKWGCPHFVHHGMVCSMAAFKAHCAFGFWRGEQVVGEGLPDRSAMGHFGRITELDQLPDDESLRAWIAKAAALNQAGVKRSGAERKRKPPPETPADLGAALATNRAAEKHFAAFSVTRRRDYIDWLTEAKTAATRAKRLATAIEWIAEGKARNWKYER